MSSRLVAKIVACLADVDRHKLYLKMASSSLHGFCVDKLGMSEGAAYRRINAARLVRRFPALLPRIARGELHLSGLVLLRKHFTDENVEELAAEASGLPESKILELLARRAPRPAVPDRISAMPVAPAQVPLPATPLPAAHPQARSRTEPLSPAAYLVQLTVSADTHAKLVEARNLLSHSVPDGNLAAVVDRALDALLDRLRRERLGTGTRPRGKAKSDPGAVSRADRRAVFERDGGQCTYRSEEGERCPARSLLQTDHIVARSLGGRGDPANLQLLCGPHNRLKAEGELGAAKVSVARESRKRKSPRARQGRVAVHVDGKSAPPGSEGVPVAEAVSSGGVAASPAGEATSRAEGAAESSAGKAAERTSGAGGANGVRDRNPPLVVASARNDVAEDEARAVFGLASMGFSRPACERVVRGMRSRGGPELGLVAVLREAIGTLSAQRA